MKTVCDRALSVFLFVLASLMATVTGCDERSGGGAGQANRDGKQTADRTADEQLPWASSPEQCVGDFVDGLRSGDPGRAVRRYCDAGEMALRAFGSAYTSQTESERGETCRLISTVISAPYAGEGLSEHAAGARCSDFEVHSLPGKVFEVRYKIHYPTSGATFDSFAQVRRGSGGRMVVIDVAGEGGVPLTHLISAAWLETGTSPLDCMRGFAASMLAAVEEARAAALGR